jgi:hypothetical protein
MKISVRQFFRFLFRESNASSSKEEMIRKYREHDSYDTDITVFEKEEIFIPKKLPSEPEEGITYRFGPTGFI